MLQALMDPVRSPERRGVIDRRRRTLQALVRGSVQPRRRGPRRATDAGLAAVDWHDAQWLAVALLILVFSGADGFLTLMLMERGAYEANPVMEYLVHSSGLAFAVAKIALTATGVIVLTLLARLRAFGRFRVSTVLYGVLIGYGLLVFYELWLLERLIAAG